MSSKLFYDYMKALPAIREETHESVHALEREYSEGNKGWSKDKTLKHYCRFTVLDQIFNKHLIEAEKAKWNNDYDAYFKHLDRFIAERNECKFKATK